jgi:hypothetical protein
MTTPADSSRSIQNGSVADIRSMSISTYPSTTPATASPSAAAAVDSSSASTKSCATMRRRLAPSAVRTAISPARATVRA